MCEQLQALTREAERLDSEDELASFRQLFYVHPGQIYLDGNSLGLLSQPAESAVLEALHAWKTLLIEGWTAGASPWFFLAEWLGAKTAPLIGAEPDEVIVANSTTVNLHQLLATLFHSGGLRDQLLMDALAFPSDLYALQSHLRLRGLSVEEHLRLVPSRDGLTLDEGDIVAAMTDRVQMAVLPSVLYVSGQMLNIEYLTEQAHRRGILIGFDCSHSIGTMPHHLSAWNVDFAFWCGYKYLNGGPGAAGGLYLNRKHFGRSPGLAGWFSSRKNLQFDMLPVVEAAPNAGALQIGTPNILSMAALQGALELIAQAGVDRLRRKSLALTRFLMELAESELTAYGFTIVTPREDEHRGGHIALRHPEAARIGKALRAEGVIPDHRPPDIVRLAPAALYTSFGDCLAAIRILSRIMERQSYLNVETGRELVP